MFPTKIFSLPISWINIHRNFFHSPAEKLFKLIRKAQPDGDSPETYDILKDILTGCNPFQRMQNGPKRFWVSFGADEVIFNELLFLDVMYIDDTPVLHVIYEATWFSAAKFLHGMSKKHIRNASVECWPLVYTGIPNRIFVDQEFLFWKSFIAYERLCNVEVSQTGIEFHNSLGLGDRYHQPLGNTFLKISLTHNRVPKELRLSMAAEVMNDTLGLEGKVPSALVFGKYLQLWAPGIGNIPKPHLSERSRLAEQARREIA